MLIKKTMFILSIFHLIIPIPSQAGLEEALRAHERERTRDRATNASQSQPSWRQEYHHEYRQAEQPPVGIRATIRADEETNERILRNRRLYEATHPQQTSSERLGHVVHEHNAAVQAQQKNATTLKIVSDPKVCAVEAQSKATEMLSDFNQNSTQSELQTKLKEVTQNLQQENAKIDKMDERAGYAYNGLGGLSQEALEQVLHIIETGSNQQINNVLLAHNIYLTDNQITNLHADFYARNAAILQMETFKEAKIQLERIIATKEYAVSAEIASFKSTFAQQDPDTQARSYLELSADLGHKKANEEYLKIDKERAQIQMQHGEWGKQKVIQTCDDTTKHYEDPIALLQAKQQMARESIIANYDTELCNKSVDELTEMLSASKNKQAKLEKDLDRAWREANNCKGTLHQKYPNVKNNRQVAKIEQGLQETARDFAKVQENLAMEKEKEKKIGENLERNRTKEQLAAETNEKTKVESAQRRHHSKSQEAESSSSREYREIEQRLDKGKRKADASTTENSTTNAPETKEKFESALGQFCCEHFTEEGAQHKQQKEFTRAENDWTDAKVRLSEIEGALELEKKKTPMIAARLELHQQEKDTVEGLAILKEKLSKQLQEFKKQIKEYDAQFESGWQIPFWTSMKRDQARTRATQAQTQVWWISQRIAAYENFEGEIAECKKQCAQINPNENVQQFEKLSAQVGHWKGCIAYLENAKRNYHPFLSFAEMMSVYSPSKEYVDWHYKKYDHEQKLLELPLKLAQEKAKIAQDFLLRHYQKKLKDTPIDILPENRNDSLSEQQNLQAQIDLLKKKIEEKIERLVAGGTDLEIVVSATHLDNYSNQTIENSLSEPCEKLGALQGKLDLEKEKERLISEEIARCEKLTPAQWREREQQLTTQLQECTQKIENYKKMEERANAQKNLPWAREEREKEEARIQTINAQLPSIYGMLQQKTFTTEYKQQLENIKNELSLKTNRSPDESTRLEAIIKTLQEQGTIYTIKCKLCPQTSEFLKKYGVAIEKFQYFAGNKIECELFSESNQQIETARSVGSRQSNNPNVKNCIQTAIRFGEKAVDMAYVGDIQNASQMNDLSQAFTNLGHCIRITDSFVSPMEQATNHSEEICTQQKTNNLIKLSEATLDVVSTYQHTPSTVDNPYAGLHALEKIGRCLQCFAQGAGHATLEFSSTVNQVITDPQKAATDLFVSLSRTVENYFNQKMAIYDQCTGDFSRIHEQLKDAPDSIKKYYEALAHQYRCDFANINLNERDIETWVVNDIIRDKQKAARWEAIKKMPAEKIAYHAGKFAAETILTEGVFRFANGALKIANVEMQLLHQEVKTGASVLAATAKETVEQTAKQFALTADQWGTRMIQSQVPKAEKIVEIAAADTGNIFKITIKNPCLTEACEKIAANPLKMEMVKDAAGKAGAQAIKKTGEETTLAGTTLKLPENVVKAMEEIAERPVEAEIIKEAGTAGVQAATREAISLAGYDASLGNLKKLEEAANMFKNNASAISKDGPLTRLLKCGKAGDSVGNLASARGAGYELEKAYDLAKTGEKIIGFGNKTPLVHPKTGLVIKVLDVDIETATKIIECKSIDWTKATAKGIDTIKSKLPELRELALSKGKSFEFHSKLEIPNDLKNWLNDQKITFIVG